MPNVEVRKVETEYHETGVGVSPRTDVSYEVGAVIEGKWVSFASVNASRLESLPDDKQDAEPEQQPQPSKPQPSKG